MSPKPYVLHYAPDNASLVIRLALEETGQAYETRLVNRSRSEQRQPSYLELNPNGLIPVLETEQGPLFETAAILLWLADRHGGLAPAPDSADRGDCLKWLFFMSNTLHPALRRLFYPAVYIGEDPGDQAQLNRVTQALTDAHLRVLDRRFETARPGIVLDLYLGPMLRWLALYPSQGDRGWFRLSQYPALHEAARLLERRTCVRAAALAEGLGQRPFTQPLPPNPPEGSAT